MNAHTKERAKSTAKTPEFLARAGLYDGDWITGSKFTAAALIRPEIFPIKVNILGVLICQAFGYDSELGVVMRTLKEHEDVASSKAIVKLFESRDPKKRAAVTEVLTPQGIASRIKMAWLDAWKEAGIGISPELLAAIKTSLSKQHMRTLLQRLEEDGMIVRARVNCQPQKLAGVSFDQALSQGLVTPLSKIPVSQKKRLGLSGQVGGSVCVFLLAKPKPAKNLTGKVADAYYLPADNSNASNDGSVAFQYFLNFMRESQNDLKKLLQQAAKLGPREDIQAALKAHQEVMATNNAAFKEFLLKTFASPVQLPVPVKAVSAAPPSTDVQQELPLYQPIPVPTPSAVLNSNGTETHRESPTVAHPPQHARTADPKPITANEFHEAINARLRDVKAGPATRNQTTAAYSAVTAAKAGDFLDWLSPLEMHRRKPQHGGILPHLIEEWRTKYAQIEEAQREREERHNGGTQDQKIAAWSEMLADPNEDEAAKAVARNCLARAASEVA